LKNARLQAKQLQSAASKIKNKRGKVLLPGKLTTSTTKDPTLRELFIVEGDSAAGSARRARYPEFQEVLAIRGKIINAAKSSLSKTLNSEEVQAILTATGLDLKELKNRTYRIGKILALCDSDEDGKNIEVLLATLFQTIAPDLYEKGMIYVVDAPLYFATCKDKQYSGNTFEEIREKMPKSAPDHLILRMKGWGECSAEILRDLAFNVKTRNILKITPLKNRKERSRFEAVVGEDTNMRKELLGVS